jgi:hypothetical protein
MRSDGTAEDGAEGWHIGPSVSSRRLDDAPHRLRRRT